MLETVASEGAGVDELVAALDAFRGHQAAPGLLERRRARAEQLLRRLVTATVARSMDELVASGALGKAARQVADGELDPYVAVDALLDA